MATTDRQEPEEAIEAALVAKLAAACAFPVEGVLAPATAGTVKRLSSDTFVSVAVDQTSKDLDMTGANVPFTYSATVTVHCALADDPDGANFSAACRAVRACLWGLEDCDSLAADAFDCDEFIVDSTSTSFEGGDNPVTVKSYTATIKGRVTV